MAAQFTDDQITEFKEIFDLFDQNDEGRIPTSKLPQALWALGQNPSRSEIEDMMKEVEHLENGKIDFPEFLVLIARKSKQSSSEEELIEAFKLFDRDGDGVISVAELRFIFKTLGEQYPDDELDDMIKACDLDRDGLINYEEVVRKMVKDSKP